jgi:hypothetical protein
MMIAGSPHLVTGRPGKVRAAAIRRVTLAGAAVILVGAGPVAAAMAAPGYPGAGQGPPVGPNDRAGARAPAPGRRSG